MTLTLATDFQVRLARSPEDLRAAQRLRYDVFVTELGGGGEMVDHAERLERDAFDAHCDHLLLIEQRTRAVVGVYRVMRPEQAQQAQCYYSDAEYDLSPLHASGRRLLELGRSCLHRDHRGGVGMHHLWSALYAYVQDHDIEVLFGVASFAGTDVSRLAQPLSLLNHRHLAPKEQRVKAVEKSFQSMDLVDEADLDRKTAMVQMPSLIKAYLRLGGVVGEGAYIDHTFNTTDVCMILDKTRMSPRQARIYGGQQQ